MNGGLPVMKIKDIGKKLGAIALKVAGSGCRCAGESGSSGDRGGNRKPCTVVPDDKKEASPSKEAIG